MAYELESKVPGNRKQQKGGISFRDIFPRRPEIGKRWDIFPGEGDSAISN